MKNQTYRELAGVSDATAGRDLRVLAQRGLLRAVGERRGRFYRATPALVALDRSIRQVRRPLEDPFETGSAAPTPRL